MDKNKLTEKHNFVNDTIFKIKIVFLTAKRVFKNLIYPIKNFKNNGLLNHESIVSFSESALWNPFDNKDNWILTAGKIQNLRIASKKLNGIEVKANEIFSFWQNIGNPNFGKGYVIGREIREGCIVPTIAGGLCQLSNALYDAALKANFEIIERHRHTKVIKGSLAEQNRDATVKWNYIDLRFKSNYDFRIEIELTSDNLIVSFKSQQKNITSDLNPINHQPSNQLNDCYSCGNTACFKHPNISEINKEIATTTFILDEKWPEYDHYIKSIAAPSDNFIVPLKKSRWIKTNRYFWAALNLNKTKATTFQAIFRAVRLRYTPKNKNNVFELSLQLDKKIAHAAAKCISIDSTHLIIAQNLLPFINETGALGGRTYDVLMTRLPIEKLHERLDFAHSKYPESYTLKDFRAPKRLIELENKALTKARKIITTHSEIQQIFKNKVEKLDWQIPTSEKIKSLGNKVLFPASAIGRKGAYEIKKLAKELNLNLVISGKTLEHLDFWDDIKIEKFNGDFSQIGLIVYPTYIEHQPRQILKGISKGLSIITTTACGVDPSDQVKIVEIANFEQLKNEVYLSLKNSKDQN